MTESWSAKITSSDDWETTVAWQTGEPIGWTPKPFRIDRNRAREHLMHLAISRLGGRNSALGQAVPLSWLTFAPGQGGDLRGVARIGAKTLPISAELKVGDEVMSETSLAKAFAQGLVGLREFLRDEHGELILLDDTLRPQDIGACIAVFSDHAATRLEEDVLNGALAKLADWLSGFHKRLPRELVGSHKDPKDNRNRWDDLRHLVRRREKIDFRWLLVRRSTPPKSSGTYALTFDALAQRVVYATDLVREPASVS